MMTDQKDNFLQKLENDVSERLWDLLIMHLVGVEDKISPSKSGDPALRARLLAILGKAVIDIQAGISHFNNLQYWRFLILTCNHILRYDPKRKDLKDLKKTIIESYTASDPDNSFLIPLDYQINEVRITYDTSYLAFLIQKLIRIGEWAKALYCLHTVRLIEPDNLNLDAWDAEIRKHLPQAEPAKASFEEPKGMLLLLDANVVLSKVQRDVGSYKINPLEAYNTEKLGNNNKFGITPTIAAEVAAHLEYELSYHKKNIEKNNLRFDFKEIEQTLKKRRDDMINRYGVKIEVKEADIEPVKEFYRKYTLALEAITLEKLNKKSISKKLRKLSQRECFLPEEGDMRFLSEVIMLNKDSDKEIGILTKDKDFTEFAKALKEEFSIKIYS
jgi:hypothetical protein